MRERWGNFRIWPVWPRSAKVTIKMISNILGEFRRQPFAFASQSECGPKAFDRGLIAAAKQPRGGDVNIAFRIREPGRQIVNVLKAKPVEGAHIGVDRRVDQILQRHIGDAACRRLLYDRVRARGFALTDFR